MCFKMWLKIKESKPSNIFHVPRSFIQTFLFYFNFTVFIRTSPPPSAAPLAPSPAVSAPPSASPAPAASFSPGSSFSRPTRSDVCWCQRSPEEDTSLHRVFFCRLRSNAVITLSAGTLMLPYSSSAVGFGIVLSHVNSSCLIQQPCQGEGQYPVCGLHILSQCFILLPAVFGLIKIC